MTTDVQLLRSGSFEDVPFTDFQIDLGVSTQKTVPEASFTTLATEAVSAGQEARIVIDGTTRFRGICANSGRKEQGQQSVTLTHDASELFSTDVSFTETGPPTDEAVLDAALTSAVTDNTFTLDYNGTAVVLNNEYDAENRPVKQVFQDMMDRTDKVWWVDPVDNIVHVGAKGGRGLWQTLDTEADPGVEVRSFEAGDIATVRNTVTVTGTGKQATSATATDTASIDQYGQRTKAYQVDYAITSSEAQALADELLQPDPIPEAEIRVSQNVGDIVSARVNQTLDLDDAAQDIFADDLLIERQTIEQGRATLSVGGGAGATVEDVNRDTKSDGDVTRPGSVYDTDRIADNAIETAKIVDLSISETKIQDDAISTPKLQAEAVTANEILANTITAAQIDVLDLAAGELTISDDPDNPTTGLDFTVNSDGRIDISPSTSTRADLGLERDFAFVFSQNAQHREGLSVGVPPAASNANGFSTFEPDNGNTPVFIGEQNGITSVYPLDDGEGQLGTSSNSWNNIYAFNYIDAGTGSAINDGGDPTAAMQAGDRPPEFCRVCDDDGTELGLQMNDLVRHLWEVCTHQQEKLDRARGRIDDLEERLSRLESQV